MNSLNQKPYQQCSRCVMDTTASDITFDKSSVCNYCSEFLARSSHVIHENLADKEARLKEFVELVKASGKGKPYDCIVGVSGGVDSSWTLVEVKRLGLRPLAVHMDNGWNSELAQNNIANIVNALGVDLYTYVIDWNEYRELMQSFFDADVIDIELLYDNAMLAVNYRIAVKYGISYILSGTNSTSEGMRMPSHWNWYKYDARNIKAIARKRHGYRFRTFPMISTLSLFWYKAVRKVKWISFLDYLPYNKFRALDELEERFNFKRYPYKHYESIFTRFYQGYLLPEKFGIDKRTLHLSSLVVSGQISRDEALDLLSDSPYPSAQELSDDLGYFLKKMAWSNDHLASYISRPIVSHDRYPSEYSFAQRLFALNASLRIQVKRILSKSL